MKISIEKIAKVEYHIKNKNRIIAVFYNYVEAMKAFNLLKNVEQEVKTTEDKNDS